MRTTFLIEGDAPILREKDILRPETVDTHVKQIYFCVQMMYLEQDSAKYQTLYFELVTALLKAVPSFLEPIETASKLMLSGSLYSSLREIRKLIKVEEELLKNV